MGPGYDDVAEAIYENLNVMEITFRNLSRFDLDSFDL